MNQCRVSFLATLVGWILMAGAVTAQPWAEVAKLTASDGNAGDRFGFSVALDGNRALIGAWADDDNGTDSGSAYVFAWDGSAWMEVQKLMPSDGSSYDYFGLSVALDGDYALVGAPYFYDAEKRMVSGAAYVFAWDGSAWVEVQRLSPSDLSADDRFGYRVALDGAYALVGAPGDDQMGSASGAAYVFEWNGSTWIERQKLVAPDGADNDGFSLSLSISEGRILIGAQYDDDNADDSGSAYVFEWEEGTWSTVSKLTDADSTNLGEFGKSVSVSGNRLLVGSSFHDGIKDRIGSAHLYEWDGSSWKLVVKLAPSDGAAFSSFGGSVSLDGDLALVGARGDDGNEMDTGSAYVYEWDGSGWRETKLTASDGAVGDWFGASASVSGERVLVGASFDDDNGLESGSAYVFEAGTAVGTEGQEMPADYGVWPNYPNPFKAQTRITFELPEAATVRLAVYDILGREVALLVSGAYPAGVHTVTWDGRNAVRSPLPGGVYVVRMEGEQFRASRMVLLMR